MELDLYARPLLSLIFVIGLIFIAAAAARRFSSQRGFFGKSHPPRLKVVDRLVLDNKRHLLVVRHHESEHVLFLGHNNDFLVGSTPPARSRTHSPVSKEGKHKLTAERSTSILAPDPLP